MASIVNETGRRIVVLVLVPVLLLVLVSCIFEDEMDDEDD
jgi:hypothetical protein